MQSRFGTVQIDTARRWTVPELYLALSAHKDELPSPPELRNYAPEAGLYLDAVGVYTLYFQPGEASGVKLKLWCPRQELRIPPSRRGSAESSYPGKAEATPLLEQTADTVSRILLEAEAKNRSFDTALVPPEESWGLSFHAWLPLAAAEWTSELSVVFQPPICLSEEEQAAILRRCPGSVNPDTVVFYAESRRFLRQSDVFVVTESGIFGCIGAPFAIVFAEIAFIETDLGGTVTLTKTSGQTEVLALGRFGKAMADIAQKAAAYGKAPQKEGLL